MYSEILVPLDGSHLSGQVLPYVRMLAGSFKLPVHLFPACNPVSEELANPLHGRYLDAVSESHRNESTAYLHTIDQTMEEIGVVVR